MKKTLLILMAFTTLFTTGCWDALEINQRIFPYSVGYDLSDSKEGRYNITFTYPNIYAFGKNAKQDIRVHIITSTANDIFEAVHNISSRLQYPIFNKHLKVLILQENVATNKKYVQEIVDGINRDYIMNKTLQMVVVKDSAEGLLRTVPDAARQEVIEGTLNSILMNQQHSSNFTPKTLTDFIEDIDDRGASLVPVAYPKSDEIEFTGGAVFKDFGLVGYIDHEENKSIAILNNQLIEDGFNADYNGDNLSFLATGFKSKKKLEESENLKIKFSVEIEGQIHEYILPDGVRIDNLEIVRGMEEALTKNIETDLNNIIKKMQKEYKADLIRVADYLRKYHNKLWTQVEGNWDEVFSNADITAEVVVKIRRRGLTK